jgi:hypothetical protein
MRARGNEELFFETLEVPDPGGAFLAGLTQPPAVRTEEQSSGFSRLLAFDLAEDVRLVRGKMVKLFWALVGNLVATFIVGNWEAR